MSMTIDPIKQEALRRRDAARAEAETWDRFYRVYLELECHIITAKNLDEARAAGEPITIGPGAPPKTLQELGYTARPISGPVFTDAQAHRSDPHAVKNRQAPQPAQPPALSKPWTSAGDPRARPAHHK
jgi:hypothetical protein